MYRTHLKPQAVFPYSFGYMTGSEDYLHTGKIQCTNNIGRL